MDALVGDGLMPVDPTPLRNRRQRSGVTSLCRYLPHHILSRPRLAPDVGKAEEGERGTIRLRMVRARDEITESKEKNPAAGRNAGKESGVYA